MWKIRKAEALMSLPFLLSSKRYPLNWLLRKRSPMRKGPSALRFAIFHSPNFCCFKNSLFAILAIPITPRPKINNAKGSDIPFSSRVIGFLNINPFGSSKEWINKNVKITIAKQIVQMTNNFFIVFSYTSIFRKGSNLTLVTDFNHIL